MTIKTQSNITKRATAAIIDYGLYFAFFIWTLIVFGERNEHGEQSLKGIKALCVPIAWMIYFPVSESITGKTLGKKMIGLSVVSKSGNPISFWQALIRRAADILDFSCFGLVAFLTIKNTTQHQRLGDLWAKTIVTVEYEYACPNCRELLMLTAKEITIKEFVCPACNTTLKIQKIDSHHY